MNVWGLIHGMREVMPHMIERGSGHGCTGVSVSAVLPSAVRTRLASGVPLGHGMPTVDAEDAARAIVGSVRRRPAEPVMRLGRKAIGDRRALTSVQHDVRAAYEATIAAQAQKS